jgi:hypothetical protein
VSNCPLWTNHLSPFRVSPPLSVPIPDSHEDGQTIEPCAGGGDAGRSQRRHHIVHPRGARPVADRRRPTADTPAPGGVRLARRWYPARCPALGAPVHCSAAGSTDASSAAQSRKFAW